MRTKQTPKTCAGESAQHIRFAQCKKQDASRHIALSRLKPHPTNTMQSQIRGVPNQVCRSAENINERNFKVEDVSLTGHVIKFVANIACAIAFFAVVCSAQSPIELQAMQAPRNLSLDGSRLHYRFGDNWWEIDV